MPKFTGGTILNSDNNIALFVESYKITAWGKTQAYEDTFEIPAHSCRFVRTDPFCCKKINTMS
jgi:hypothetical protein